MFIKKLIWVLVILLSLLLFAQRAVAEPIEIESEKLPHIQVYAFQKVLEKWDDEQWSAFDNIIDQESGHWTILGAHYPSGYTKSGVKSSAYGLAGFLDSTWATVGCKKTSDPYTQIDCAIEYISERYGTPEKAWAHHKLKNWY